MKIIRVRVCAPDYEKEDDLEDILATDDLFVEYFNEYLALPVFLEPLWFNRDLGTFEVVDGAKQKVAKRLKAAIRASRGVSKIYRPTQHHSFCTISLIPLESGSEHSIGEIDTSFSVTMLNKEQGMKWVKTHRFPTFLRSDLYVEYRLAKIISQVECSALSRGEAIKVSLDATPLARKVKPEDLVPAEDSDDSEEIMKSMCVSMGEASTTDVDSWISLARTQMHTATTVTSSSQDPKISSHEAVPAMNLTLIGAESSDHSSGNAEEHARDNGVTSRLFGETASNAVKSATPRPEDKVCHVLQEAGGGILEKFSSRSSPFYVATTSKEMRRSNKKKNAVPNGDSASGAVNADGSALLFPTLDTLSDVLVGTAFKHAFAAISGHDMPQMYSQHDAVRAVIKDSRHRNYALADLESAGCFTDLGDDAPAIVSKAEPVGSGDSRVFRGDDGSGSDDSGYAAITKARADKFISSRLRSSDDRKHVISAEKADIPETSGLLVCDVDRVARSTQQLHAALREAEISKRSDEKRIEHKQEDNGDDSALESDDDYEEDDKTVFKRHSKTKKHPLTSKKGIDSFKAFLKGTVGERNWELWLDIDRTRFLEGDGASSQLEIIKSKYSNQGASLELAKNVKEELGLIESCQWTLSNLLRLQASVAEPLLTYWAPRYVLRRSLDHGSLDSHPDYKLYKWVANAATLPRASSANATCRKQHSECLAPVGPGTDVTKEVTLPLRPKSCAPRLRTVESERTNKYEGPTPKEFTYAPPAQVSLPEVTPPLGQRRAQSVAAVELVTSKARMMTDGWAEKRATSALGGSSLGTRTQSARLATAAPSPRNSTEPSKSVRPATASPRPSSSQSACAPQSGKTSRLNNLENGRAQSRLSQASEGEENSRGDSGRISTSGGPDGLQPDNNRHAEVESTASSDVSTELFGGRRMEILLKALTNESKSGKFFRRNVEAAKNKRTLFCLLFWEEVQEYRHLFYGKVFSSYAAHKKAQEIFSLYIAITGSSNISCGADICKLTAERLHPPYEDLFDVAEEYALGILFEAWQLTASKDMAALDEVDTKTFTRALETKTKYIINLQRRGLLKSSDNLLEDPMEGYKDPVYDPTLIDKIPEDFREFTFDKLVRTPIYLETYRQFLQANFASTDLNCWTDIEQFRRLPPDATTSADAKAREIKTKYLNKRYFFGPNSPATREGLDQIMQSVGGWGNIFPDRPPDQLIIQAQTYVQQRLEKKWMPLFLASRQFEELHRPDQHMADAAEAILLQKRRKNQAIYKMLESKWISSSNEIMAFRKALLNPVLSYQFQRYVSIKSDSLENDVLFWKEVQKYKKMHHSHTSEAFIQQKITVIINCFIESPIPPAVQIDIPPEQVERILDKRREMGPYLFREAQLAVFRVLFEYWSSFCEFRSDVATDEVITTLERHRRRAKIRERKRAQKLEEQKEKFQRLPTTANHTEIARRRALGLPIDDEDEEDEPSGQRQASSHYHEHARDAETGDAQDVPKVAWSYSHYVNAYDREDVLTKTDDDTFSSLMDEDVFTELHRMRNLPRPEVPTINVSDLKDVKALGNKETISSIPTEPLPATKSSSNATKPEKPQSAKSFPQPRAAKPVKTANEPLGPSNSANSRDAPAPRDGGECRDSQPSAGGPGIAKLQQAPPSAGGRTKKPGVTFVDGSAKTADGGAVQVATPDRRATLQTTTMGAMVAVLRKGT